MLLAELSRRPSPYERLLPPQRRFLVCDVDGRGPWRVPVLRALLARVTLSGSPSLPLSAPKSMEDASNRALTQDLWGEVVQGETESSGLDSSSYGIL